MTGVSQFMYISAVKEIERLKSIISGLESQINSATTDDKLEKEITKLKTENTKLKSEIKALQKDLAE